MRNTKTIYDLTQFENAPKLLKEWGNEPDKIWTFERLEKHATQAIIDGLRHRIIIERGTNEGKQLYFEKDYIEAFGLPYTSSSDFAAIWNTNSQARAKYGKALYFRGAAIEAETHDTILIFEDSSEKYFYFKEWQYIGYQEEQEKIAEAVKYTQLVKEANQLKHNAYELLKAYEGRKLGTKTREQIQSKLTDEAKKINAKLQAYFNYDEYAINIKHFFILKVSYQYDYTSEISFYFDELNENTLTLKDEPASKEENDGKKVYFERQAMKRKIYDKAKELSELLNTYNGLSRKINQSSKNTQPYNCNLDALTRFDF